MKKYLLGLMLAIAALAIVGCTSTETSGTETAGTETTNGQPKEGTTPETGTATVAMAACAGCSKEMAAADLKDHDGKKYCQACIDAHGH